LPENLAETVPWARKSSETIFIEEIGLFEIPARGHVVFIRHRSDIPQLYVG
jgi:hypothetical protein